jgi:hypothetical protein
MSKGSVPLLQLPKKREMRISSKSTEIFAIHFRHLLRAAALVKNVNLKIFLSCFLVKMPSTVEIIFNKQNFKQESYKSVMSPEIQNSHSQITQ